MLTGPSTTGDVFSAAEIARARTGAPREKFVRVEEMIEHAKG